MNNDYNNANANENENGMSQNKKDKITDIIILAVIAVFFFAVLIINGVPMYNDSDQYISMHVRREPVYPVFLYIIRVLFKERWLIVTGLIQTVITVLASYSFVKYFAVRFRLNAVCKCAVCGFVLMPYILTPLFSTMHVTMSCAVMSESIAIPLFLIFFVYIHRGISDNSAWAFAAAFVLGIVLSLIRSNFVVLLIVWLISAAYACIRERKWTLFILCFLLFICSFPVRSAATKGYNLVFNGRFIGNQYTNVTALTNIFYASERDAGALIADDDLREKFYILYDDMEEKGWSYKAVGGGIAGRAVYLEEVHDRIKFDVLEYGLRDMIEETGVHDYLDYNAIAEDYAGRLIRILFPAGFLRWLPDWLIMGLRGVTRSVAVCNPVAYIYTAVIILFSIILAVMLLKRDRRSPAALAMLISMLVIFGNAFGTAVLIMCLSRYMVYGFPVFYTSLMCACIEMYNKSKNVI